MKKLFNKTVVLLIIISLFFIGNIKINAEEYRYDNCRHGYFSWYYTNDINSSSDKDNYHEVVKVVFVPNNKSIQYSIATKYGNKWSNKDKKYTDKGIFTLDTSGTTQRQLKINIDGDSCLSPTFDSYESTYEITKLAMDEKAENIIVEGYTFVLTKNGIRVHTINPTITLGVTNAENIYLDESKFTPPTSGKNSYLSRCEFVEGKYYKCPKDSYTLLVASNIAEAYVKSDSKKVDLRSDYSYTRYYAREWSVGNWSLKEGTDTTPGVLEYMYLFNLNTANFSSNPGTIGANLNKGERKNNDLTMTQEVIKYFINPTSETYSKDIAQYGNKLYVNVNFKFVIPIEKLSEQLSKKYGTANPKLKFKLNIKSNTDAKKIYTYTIKNTDSIKNLEPINANITLVGLIEKNVSDVQINNNKKITFNIESQNTKIRFLNLSEMRGRLYTAANKQVTLFEMPNGSSPYFANTYGSGKIYLDSFGASKYNYYVNDIVHSDLYYPINLYGLKIEKNTSNNSVITYDCSGKSKKDGTCMKGAAYDEANKVIYALSTWISPQNSSKFSIGCTDGYTLFGNSCCATNMLINEYKTSTKTCCTQDKIVKNFINKRNECCMEDVREENGIRFCENACKNINCPVGSDRDIDGKCCKPNTISIETGKCIYENEVEATDDNSIVCKVSDMVGISTCNCSTLNESYKCDPNTEKTEVTPKRTYKTSLINGGKTTCEEQYTLTIGKVVKVVQGGSFKYSVGFKVVRECSGGGVSEDNLPKYSLDKNIIKTAVANIQIKDTSKNANQDIPVIREKQEAIKNLKYYDFTYETGNENVQKIGDKIIQTIQYTLEYKYNYYMNYINGKIIEEQEDIDDDYFLAGRNVFLLLNAKPDTYNNDVIININGNKINIDCEYKILENKAKNYLFKQFDEKNVFARTKKGYNWTTDTANAIISKIENNVESLYEPGRAMYEINLDKNSINKIKNYINTNSGYYNSSDDKNFFSEFSIIKNPDDNILKEFNISHLE